MKKNILVSLCIIFLIVLIGVFCIKIISNNNEEIIFEESKYFLLKTKSGIGVIDRVGNTIIDPKYVSIEIPNDKKDVFFCKSLEKVDILNSKGEALFVNKNVSLIPLSRGYIFIWF